MSICVVIIVIVKCCCFIIYFVMDGVGKMVNFYYFINIGIVLMFLIGISFQGIVIDIIFVVVIKINIRMRVIKD